MDLILGAVGLMCLAVVSRNSLAAPQAHSGTEDSAGFS